MVQDFLVSNSLVMSFLYVGILMLISQWVSKRLFKSRIHASALGILLGLLLAYVGGCVAHGSKGLADISVFSGLSVLGGSMFRDFTVVATTYGADLSEFRKCGKAGAVALFCGVVLSFLAGMVIAIAFGYRDVGEITVIAAGAVTFIVGPVTASALGVTSNVVAISIGAGVIKSIAIMVLTPFAAKWLRLNTPKSAMIYGALLGSTSGVSAGLAATNEKLVPYGTMMASFYMGVGCLLCPTVLYWLVRALAGVLF